MSEPVVIKAFGLKAHAFERDLESSTRWMARCDSHEIVVFATTLIELERVFWLACEYHLELDRAFPGHMEFIKRTTEVTP